MAKAGMASVISVLLIAATHAQHLTLELGGRTDGLRSGILPASQSMSRQLQDASAPEDLGVVDYDAEPPDTSEDTTDTSEDTTDTSDDTTDTSDDSTDTSSTTATTDTSTPSTDDGTDTPAEEPAVDDTSTADPTVEPDTASPDDTSTSPDPATDTSTGSEPSSGIDFGAIAGGAVAAVVLFVLVCTIGCLCRKRRRNKAQKSSYPAPPHANGPQAVGAAASQPYPMNGQYTAAQSGSGGYAALGMKQPQDTHGQYGSIPLAQQPFGTHPMHGSPGSNANTNGSSAFGLNSMHAADASTTSASTASNIRAQQTMGSMQSSQVTTGGSTGQAVAGSQLANVYHAAFPTKYSDTTFDATAGAGPQAAPGPGASSESKQEHVQYQIDSLGAAEVLDGLVLQQGLRTRLLGGQAVVQFAKDRRNDLEYAIKFYLSQSAFTDEASLYTDRGNPLGQFLPEVRNIVSNEDGQFQDAYGAPMAPCIAMERGESLDIWSGRNKGGLDMITGLQVIHHIAERLDDLHSAGYCHRDLKPGNVMWLPRQNRWTLIDFGCAARIGQETRMGYSLAYAAPEIIHAVRAGRDTVVGSDKLDAWSLGVMAVELLTNKSPFNLLEGKEKVMDKISGVEPLPWEEEATAPALLRRFGHFKIAVMSLLERDPAERPSMTDFRKQCNRVLMQTTKG